jgi:hypothetical protein
VSSSALWYAMVLWPNQPVSRIFAPLWLTKRGCPRQESNLRTRFRKPPLYPLSYGGLERRVRTRVRRLRAHSTRRRIWAVTPSLAVGLLQPVATFVATQATSGATIPHNGRLLPSPGDSVVICSVRGQTRRLPGDDAWEEAARENSGDAFDELWGSGEHHLAVGTVAECIPAGDAECTLTFEHVELIPARAERPKEPQAVEGFFLIIEPHS